MFELRIRKLAQQDLEDISEYFDKINPDFTTKLLTAIYDELETIRLNPELFQFRQGLVKARFVSTYRYGIFYRQQDAIIEVLAILHTSRNPDIWKKR